MPVTVNINAVTPTSAEQQESQLQHDKFLNRISSRPLYTKHVLATSLPRSSSSTSSSPSLENITPSVNGLTHGILRAYNYHHNVILRPDDIWAAFISQFSFFVNANSEALRSYFVAHEGKKELHLKPRGGNRFVADWADMAKEFNVLLEKEVKDPGLREWIQPGFSTSTDTDRVVAMVMMMATLKSYFSFYASFLCGIPSVTLEGDVEDWRKLRAKVDKLLEIAEGLSKATNGEDNAAETKTESESVEGKLKEWHSHLAPVFDAFVATFDVDATGNTPRDPAITRFWQSIAISGGGSGPVFLDGWLCVFSAWSSKGVWQLPTGGKPAFWATEKKHGCPEMDMEKITDAVVTVPVNVDDNGVEVKAKMLAGSWGYGFVKKDEERDTVRIVNGWAVIEVDVEGRKTAREEKKRQNEELKKKYGDHCMFDGDESSEDDD